MLQQEGKVMPRAGDHGSRFEMIVIPDQPLSIVGPAMSSLSVAAPFTGSVSSPAALRSDRTSIISSMSRSSCGPRNVFDSEPTRDDGSSPERYMSSRAQRRRSREILGSIWRRAL